MEDLAKLENQRLKERLGKCEADLVAARNRIDDDTETINRTCARSGRLEAALREIMAKATYSPSHDMIWIARTALEGK